MLPCRFPLKGIVFFFSFFFSFFCFSVRSALKLLKGIVYPLAIEAESVVDLVH